MHTRFEYLLPVEDGGLHDRYEGSWIHMLNAAGYSFHGFDLVGHGRSEFIGGMQCYFEAFDDLAKDACDFARRVRARQREAPGAAELPVFILGESLGGGIAVRCATMDAALADGLVLTAPMLTLEKLARKGCNPYLRPFASMLSRVTPGAPMAAVERNTKFPVRQLEMDRDPENYSGRGKLTRVRVAAEYLDFTESLVRDDHALMRGVRTPFITFHSRNDTFTDPEGSELLVEFAAAEDKSLVYCDSMWHALMQEDGKEDVARQIIAWLDKRS